MMVAESDELSTEELVKELEDCPGVEYVEPDYAIQSYAVPNDTYFAQQWNLQRQTSTTPGAANVPYVWGATEGSDELCSYRRDRCSGEPGNVSTA